MKAPILLAVTLALVSPIGSSRADQAASGRDFYELRFVSPIGSSRADQAASGREVYELRCRTCHGGTAPADSPIGPSLAGIIGSKAGTQATGVHSRALIDSGIVWNRESLRRFLSNPQRELPGTYMPASVVEPAQLERLLDYLGSL